MRIRWILYGTIVFVCASLPIASYLHERPWTLWPLALPAMAVLLATISAWPRIVRISAGGDSWGTLLISAALAAPVALVASGVGIFLGAGLPTSDEQGALFFIFLGAAAVPSFVGVPLGLVVPRLAVPSLRERRGR